MQRFSSVIKTRPLSIIIATSTACQHQEMKLSITIWMFYLKESIYSICIRIRNVWTPNKKTRHVIVVIDKINQNWYNDLVYVIQWSSGPYTTLWMDWALAVSLKMSTSRRTSTPYKIKVNNSELIHFVIRIELAPVILMPRFSCFLKNYAIHFDMFLYFETCFLRVTVSLLWWSQCDSLLSQFGYG